MNREFICDDFPIIASFSVYSLVHSVNQSIYLSYGMNGHCS